MTDLKFPLFVKSIADGLLSYLNDFTEHPFVDLSGKLSPHFHIKELLQSDTAVKLGIPNFFPRSSDLSEYDILCNLTYLTHYVLEPLRLRFGPVKVNSAYRCQTVNEAVGGVPTSYHLFGRAADIVPLNIGLDPVCSYLDHLGVHYIKYPTFIHVQI